MSRTVLWLVVGGAVVVAGGLAVAWRGQLHDKAVLDQATRPVAAAPVPSIAPGPPAASPQPVAPPQAASAAPAAGVPTFDIARIGPDGRAVIAGRAAPGAKIVLLNGGKEIARGVADARGEWVVIAQDPPLSAGQHELRVVQHIDGRAPVTSEQVVVAIVPEPPSPTMPDPKAPAPQASAQAPTAQAPTAQAPTGQAPTAQAPAATVPSASPGTKAPKEETLVMISPPGGPATLVQPPTSAGVPRSGDLAMSTLDYDERGRVTVTGIAAAGAVVRVYIDGVLVGEAAAGVDGRWKVTPADPVGPGKHTVRLDRLAGDGKPVARLELPFDRVEVPSASRDVRRLVVVRGDNLWNIARAHYGTGFHHTVIYGANKEQIRDPDLIYPGQVFSLPKVN